LLLFFVQEPRLLVAFEEQRPFLIGAKLLSARK
jgi:hypothetical protein